MNFGSQDGISQILFQDKILSCREYRISCIVISYSAIHITPFSCLLVNHDQSHTEIILNV